MTPLTFFKPLPGRFGAQLNTESGVFGTITATGTTTIPIGNSTYPQWFNRAAVGQAVTLVASGGTVVMTVYKYDSINTTAVALTAGVNLLTAAQVVGINQTIPALTTLTDSQRTLHTGDCLYAQIVASTTITTQPQGGFVNCDLYALS